MELTYESVRGLRDEGLSWRQIGLVLADEYGGDPYRLQERARSLWRRSCEDISLDTREKSKSLGQQSEDDAITRKSRKINKDGSDVSEIEVLGKEISSLDDEGLLRKHGYDPRYWRVIDSTCALRGGKWSSRVKVVAKEVPQLEKEEFASFLADSLDQFPLFNADMKPREVKRTKDRRLVVVPLYDVHYGRRGVDGDHKRTQADVMSVIEQLCRRLDKEEPLRVVITIGQDFLNADTVDGATTKGTPQDNSMVWHEMLSGGLALAVWVVEKLAPYGDLDIIYNEGNHDRVLSYAIIKALEQRYRDNPDIRVDSDAHPRKYIQYHESLIGLSHGKDEVSISTTMQVEEPLRWGHTKKRYWLLGHLHHLDVTEKDGVTLIRCPSLAFEDEWTRRKGYVSSDRALACAVFGEEGLDDVWLIRP